MSQIKINKEKDHNDLTSPISNNENQFIKQDDNKPSQRKLFQNKKANIALITVSAVLILVYLYMQFIYLA